MQKVGALVACCFLAGCASPVPPGVLSAVPVEVGPGERAEAVSAALPDYPSVTEVAAVPQPPKRGFMGRLLAKAVPEVEAAPIPGDVGLAATLPQAEPEVEKVAAEPAADPAPAKKRFKLFGKKAAPAVVTDDAQESATPQGRIRRDAAGLARVEAGTVLPFGQAAVVCGVRGRALGKQIDAADAKFKLYDSNPKSLGPRNFYVTGFKDGCARQFTAAVALFGSIELYELVHFGGGGGIADAETDTAYRKLRSGACKSTRRGPCSASGVKKMARSTAFVTAYQSKGSSRRLELLLNGGAVVAAAVK